MEIPRMLNVCYTLYNPPKNTVQTHFNLWKQYPKDVIKNTRFILIDDCSDYPIDINPTFKLNLIYARITDNIYWNLPGARNLAFHLASDDWCVSLDMDHFIPSEAMSDIFNLKKDRMTVYRFQRMRNGKRHTIHRDSFIIHKCDYWGMGGYDEDMSGCRGANEDLIDATIKYNNYDIVNTDITLINDETYGKVGGTRRELVTRNYVKLKQKLLQMEHGNYYKTSHLRFKWVIVKELYV